MKGEDRLDVAQDLRFQRREWRFQHLGLVTLAAFVIAALLGVFGDGPLSRSRAQGADTLAVDYERLTRAHRTTRFEFVIPTAAGQGELAISRDYFDLLRIERIDPEPSSVIVGEDDVRFRFDSPTVVFDAVLTRPGVHAAVFSAGGPPLAVRQFVFF